jgi:hypothetical protein
MRSSMRCSITGHYRNSHRPHTLSVRWAGYLECHVGGAKDWLWVYIIFPGNPGNPGKLILFRRPRLCHWKLTECRRMSRALDSVTRLPFHFREFFCSRLLT